MLPLTLAVGLLALGGFQHKEVARSLESLGNTVQFSHIKTVQHPERKTA